MPNLAHKTELERNLPTQPDMAPRGDNVSYAFLEKKLTDQFWRLNNLYKIVNKRGELVTFKLNWAQMEVWKKLHYRDVILKARQLGMSTFIEILLLDLCLFRNNFNAMVIAHGKDEASTLFQQKILFAYNNLPDALRQRIPATSESKTGLALANGSSIKVSTSARSGTYNALHISEFGKICAKYPLRAQEIISGSLPAVPLDGLVLVESTAEGYAGHFYDMCQDSKTATYMGRHLGQQDYRFCFFPWWREADYCLDEVETAKVVVPTRLTEYFERLEDEWGWTFSPGQRAWYTQEERRQGSMMRREYPAFADEAFTADTLGAYYGKQVDRLRMEGRCTTVPIQPGVPVDTWWDLGYHDYCVIVLTQTVGSRINIVDFIMDHGYGIDHYARELNKLKELRRFFFGTHWVPHDGGHHDTGSGKLRKDIAYENGLNWSVVPRPVSGIQNGIDRVRLLLDLMWFDEEHCGELLDMVGGYKKEWDENLGAFKDKPLHDDASHPADAFRVGCTKHPLAAKIRRHNPVQQPGALALPSPALTHQINQSRNPSPVKRTR